MKHAVLREVAERDVTRAVDHYLREGGAQLANRFLAALDASLARVQRRPGAGAARYSALLDMPGLRFALIKGFPWLLFYIERESLIDVVRLLHQHSDLPALLK